MVQEFSDQLFQAINTLIDKKLEQVKFDETIPCVITEKVINTENLYKVKYNNSVIYEARAKEGEQYREKDEVYVSVPNGNYDQDNKIILGKYTKTESQELKYEDPFQSFVIDKIENISVPEDTKMDFNLNKPFSIIETDIIPFPLDVQTSLNGYDFMGLQFGININDAADDNPQGAWLVSLELLQEQSEGVYEPIIPPEIDQIFTDGEEISPYFIAGKEIYGKPNSLNSIFKQRKLFNFSNAIQTSQITAVKIKIYNLGMTSGVLAIQDIQLSFGYNSNQYLDNAIHLYVEGNFNNNFIYNTEGIVDVGGQPNIKALLINQTEKTIQSSLDEDQLLRWYQYVIGEKGDSIGGGYWKYLGDEYNKSLILPSTAYTLDMNRPNSQVKAVLCKKNTVKNLSGNFVGTTTILQRKELLPKEEVNETNQNWILLVETDYYSWNGEEWIKIDTGTNGIYRTWLTEYAFTQSNQPQKTDIYSFHWVQEGIGYYNTLYYQYDGYTWGGILNTQNTNLAKIAASKPFVFTNEISQSIATKDQIYIYSDQSYFPIYGPEHISTKFSNKAFKLQVVPNGQTPLDIDWGILNENITHVQWSIKNSHPDMRLIKGISFEENGNFVDSLEQEEENISTIKSIYFKANEDYNSMFAAGAYNIIECKINHSDSLTTTFAVSFGEISTQGTGFSFKIEPVIDEANEFYKYLVNVPGKQQKFQAILTTSDGVVLKPENYNLMWKWELENEPYYDNNLDMIVYYDEDKRILFSQELQSEQQAIINNPKDYIIRETEVPNEQPNEYTIRLTKSFGIEQTNQITKGTELQKQDIYAIYNEDMKKWVLTFDKPIEEVIYIDNFAECTSEEEVINHWNTISTSSFLSGHIYAIANILAIPWTYTSKNNITDFNHYVLKATCEIEALYDRGNQENDTQTVVLEAFYPIGIVHDNVSPNTTAEGVFMLQWDNQGQLITNLEHNYDFQDPNLLVQQWRLASKYQTDWKLISTPTRNQLSYEPGGIITTPKFESMEHMAIIAAIEDTKEVIFSQPLFSRINRYELGLSNKWSGKEVYIGEGEKATIMATAIGAGIKNPKTNTFTGVVMGQFALSSAIKEGLYGFNEGMATFGIDTESGNAFFKGHIEAFSGKLGSWYISNNGLWAELNSDDIDHAYHFQIQPGYQVDDSILSVSVLNTGEERFAIKASGELFAPHIDIDNNFSLDFSTGLSMKIDEYEGWYLSVGTSDTSNFETYSAGIRYRKWTTGAIFQCGIKAEDCGKTDAIFYITDIMNLGLTHYFYVQKNGLIYTREGLTSDGIITVNNNITSTGIITADSGITSNGVITANDEIIANEGLELGFGSWITTKTNNYDNSVIGLIGYSSDKQYIWVGHSGSDSPYLRLYYDRLFLNGERVGTVTINNIKYLILE